MAGPATSERNTLSAYPSFTSLSTTAASTFTALSTSASSTSSGSTVPGIGAISGKAILALGKVTLRGAEYLIIRRRLSAISSKFPHENSENIKGIVSMYDDLLELSRLGLYPDAIRNRAIQILLVQIGSRQTRHLLLCLNKWPSVEMKIFISVLTSILDPIRLSTKDATGDMEVRAYKDSVTSWESHSVVPFVDFLSQLVQSITRAGDAILQGGTMEFLLHSYVTGFRDPLADTEDGSFYRRTAFQGACNAFLWASSNNKPGFDIICSHPFHILWSVRPATPFTDLVHNREERRMKVWTSVQKEVILWRLRSTFDMMLDWTRTYDDLFIYDVCADLLELSGSKDMDLEISIRALRTLHHVISCRNPMARDALHKYLESRPSEHSITIMSQVIRHLSNLILPNTIEAELFYIKSDTADFKLCTVPYFIHFFLNIAEVDEPILIIILATNVITLLRLLLKAELQDLTDYRGDPILAYDQPEAEFLTVVKLYGLNALLPEASELPYGVAYRRRVLCRAFDIFLHRGDCRHFLELWYIEWDDRPGGLEESDCTSLDVSNNV